MRCTVLLSAQLAETVGTAKKETRHVHPSRSFVATPRISCSVALNASTTSGSKWLPDPSKVRVTGEAGTDTQSL